MCFPRSWWPSSNLGTLRPGRTRWFRVVANFPTQRTKDGMKRFVSIIALIPLILLGSVTPAQATTFKSCKDLHKVHKHGISQSVRVINRGQGPIHPPRVSASLYSKNRKLDTDRDGIACEVVRRASTPTRTATPSPTQSAAPLPVRVISALGQDVVTPSGFQVRVSEIARSVTSPGNEQVLLKYVIKNTSASSLREQTFRMVDEKGVAYPPLNFGTFETLMIPSGVELERSLVWQRTPVGSKLVAEIDRSLDSKGGILKFGASFEVETLKERGLRPVQKAETTLIRPGVLKLTWESPTTYEDGSAISEPLYSYLEYTQLGGQTQRVGPFEDNTFFFTDRFGSLEGIEVVLYSQTRNEFSKPLRFSIFNSRIFLTP